MYIFYIYFIYKSKKQNNPSPNTGPDFILLEHEKNVDKKRPLLENNTLVESGERLVKIT